MGPSSLKPAPVRRARIYSIVDCQLLHGGYLHRLSLQAMALYLFLVVVADREGKSFYGERAIMDILRLSADAFNQALGELLSLNLVDYRRPYFWVLTLETSHGQPDQQNPLPKRRTAAIPPPDCRLDSGARGYPSFTQESP